MEDQEPYSSDDEGTNPQSAAPIPSGPEQEKVAARQLRRWSMLREHRQLHFLRAALVGLLAGVIAVLFEEALFFSESLRDTLLSWLHHFPAWGWAVLPAISAILAGLAGWLTVTFAPAASGSGIPHVKAVLLQLRKLRWDRLLPVKFIGGVLAITAGLSLGREGPTVQMGAAAGMMVGTFLRIPRRFRSQLVAAGAGAGLAAAFNAPLAGFIFAIEELQREMSPLTYGTALIAAVVADIVTRTFTGQLPSFHVPIQNAPPLSALPLFALLGVVAGVAGVLFNHGLLSTLRAFHGWTRWPAWVRPALVGVLVGLVAWWLPAAIGGGQHTAELVMRGEAGTLLRANPTWVGLLGFLFLLLVVKFVLTLVSYASGVPGGIFAPLLVLGALIGFMVGQTTGLTLPGLSGTPMAFAVVGMAAMFASIVRAPLTGIVLILEMTANYGLLFPLLVASLIAYLVAERLHNKPVYDSLLEYDLERGGERPAEVAEPTIVEMVIEPHSRMDGKLVRELGLPQGCLLVTIHRAGQDIVPSGDTQLRPGDHLTVIVSGQNPGACSIVRARGRAH